tara:strand:- start:24 stop:758 length:735 start_codon:yes stop_codon:yes gene_type:complete
MIKQEFMFIDKALFFPGQGILAVGDLHIGYEHALRKSGFLVPETQINDMINTFEKIINKIKEKNIKLKKIIFLGDVKHFFGYEWKERYYFNKILNFLNQHINEKNIILIKGNHDKFDFSGKKMKKHHLSKGIMFLHGHESYKGTFDKKVNTIVMGHTHPSVILSDKQNIKKEKYKCFLVGKYKKKKVFILPSFIGIVEGTPVNIEDYRVEDGFSIIPTKYLKKFRAYVINDNKEVLDFGEVGKM